MTDEPPKALPPKKYNTWEEEKEDMLKVIEAQRKYATSLSSQIAVRDAYIKKLETDAKKYGTNVDDLANEFKVCEEDIGFKDVGGLDGVIGKIQLFQQAMTYPQFYSYYDIRPPRGLLLYGPPGTGKTMLAKAMSKEMDCYFLELPITRFISKWVGEAEKTLDAILKKCVDISQGDKKVLVFMDEAETIFGKRGQNHDSGVTDKCVSVWLRYMDGIDSSDGIIYVAATNKIEMIDEAIKRQGRFDFLLEVPNPSKEGLREIFRKQIETKERHTKAKLYDIDNMDKIVDKLHRAQFTGADINGLLRIVSEAKITELITKPIEEVVTDQEYMISQEFLERHIDRFIKGRERKGDKVIGFTLPGSKK